MEAKVLRAARSPALPQKAIGGKASSGRFSFLKSVATTSLSRSRAMPQASEEGVRGASGAPTSLMKSAMSAGLVGSARVTWGRARPNGASLRSGGRPKGAPRAASSAGWRSWSMS